MEVSKNKVVSIHYTLKDNQGNVIDSSSEGNPLSYIHGNGSLIQGMEEGLEGKAEGDKFDLSIPPEKGYGEKHDNLVQKVPKSAFGDQDVKPGMQFSTQDGHTVTVSSVEPDGVTVDGNHPLAGMDLNFNIEVVDIREATKEEIDHGHVHGKGDHQH